MIEEARKRIAEKGLKVTLQRLAVYDYLLGTSAHPTAEEIIKAVTKTHPTIAVGTVYKTLETLEKERLIRRVKTVGDVMRYDANMDKHHHLYCDDCNKIEDFDDPELTKLIEDYFRKKHIEGFSVKHIRLQIEGNFEH